MVEFSRSFRQAARLADWPVLIAGEPGTGKELIAQALHQKSLRRNGPFLKLDCLRGPRQFLESQIADLRRGCLKVESEKLEGGGLDSIEANGAGTIFFHEVAELSANLQGEVARIAPTLDLGEPQSQGTGDAGPRILASSSKDLRQEVAQGKFHQNLYLSLSGIVLEVPPLRLRGEDVATLASYFLSRYSRELGSRQRPPSLSRAALDVLSNYSWPGNLAELATAMKRVVFEGSEDKVVEGLGVTGASPRPGGDGHNSGDGLKSLAREAAEKVEREAILRALRAGQWNRKRAARELHVSYKTLLHKIKHLGLVHES